MIDYNISPSFIYTKEPSYLLSDTASADMYSTEFEQYRKLTSTVYKAVNDILSQTGGYDWTGREVEESGVIVNTYEKNGSTLKVVINYTDEKIVYEGNTVDALSAAAVK